jgi:hypothetical protein
MPNNSPPPSGELMAIEPPDFLTSNLLNGSEYTAFEWSLLALLFTLICLIGVWAWRNRLYIPIYLYWKLLKITPEKSNPIPRQWAYLLYRYNATIQSLNASSLEKPSPSIMEQLQSICFAKEEVSRETYLAMLHHTKQQLKPLFKHLLVHKPSKGTH